MERKRMADKLENILAAIEIGSSKIVCALAEPIDKDHFRLIGFSEAASAGVKAGDVIDMGKLTDQLRLVAKEVAKTTPGHPTIDLVTSGVAGEFVRSENTNAMIVSRHESFTQSDVNRLITEVKQIALPPTMRYLDVYPQEYVIDKDRHTRNPVGLAGSRLEAKLHVVQVRTTVCQNLKRALQKSGMTLDIGHLAFNPVAAAEAILTPEEKDLGVLMIDIGAELTSVCLYRDNAVRFSRIYMHGGNRLTDEISIQTKLSKLESEKLKKDIGMVNFRQNEDVDRTRELPEYSGLRNTPRTISTSSLSAIMDEVVEDIFQQIYRDLKNERIHSLIGNGVVLTGGSSWLTGIERTAQEIFSRHLAGRDLSVRMGYPFVLDDNMTFCTPGSLTMAEVMKERAYVSKPEYSTIFGYLNMQNQRFWAKPESQEKTGFFSATLGAIKKIFVGNF